jgi:hypothetical protein
MFVPGTDKPMTRIFLCNACTKMHTTRQGADPPSECPHCHVTQESLDEGAELWIESKPQPKKPAPPPAPPALPQFIRKTERAPVQSEVDLIPQTPPDDPFSRVQSDDDYRHEWIAARVAAMVDAGKPLPGAAMWEDVENLYDEGKRRGHLP